MASRIIITPTSAIQSDLPTTVSVKAETDVFVPPYATGSELFGKPTNPSSLYGDYSLSTNPDTGRSTFVVPVTITQDSYVNIDNIDNYVDPSVNQFLGTSFRFNTNTPIYYDTLVSLPTFSTGVTSQPIPAFPTPNYIMTLGVRFTTYPAGQTPNFGTVNRIRFEWEGVNTGTDLLAKYWVEVPVPTNGIWHHVFAYLETPSASSVAKIFIDGVEQTILRTSGPLPFTFVNLQYGRIADDRIYSNPYWDAQNNNMEGAISDVYFSGNPDFKNHLNAYNTNTEIPEDSSHLINFEVDPNNVQASEWSTSAHQGQGIIGDSFVGVSNGNNTSASIDLSSKIPDLSNNFFGVSFWYKQRILGGNDDKTLINIYNTTDPQYIIPFKLRYEGYGYFQLISEQWWVDGINDASEFYADNDSLRGPMRSDDGDPHYNGYDEWIHVFAWVDKNEFDSDELSTELAINGVTKTYGNAAYYNGPTIATFDPSDVEGFVVGHEVDIDGHTHHYHFDGYMCNLHWSTDRAFKNEMSTYLNQEPTKRLFERPDFGRRELFTQDSSGLGHDVPASAWKNGITQIDGLIGKGAEPISATSPGDTIHPHIDLSDKNPIFTGPDGYVDDNAVFLGISLFFKINDTSIHQQSLITLNAGPDAPDGAGGYGMDISTWPAGGPWSGPYMWLRIGNNVDNHNVHEAYSNYTSPIVEGQWHHLFFYYDNWIVDQLHMFIDGVEQSTPSDTSTYTNLELDYIKKIYTHGVYYSSATDGPQIGRSSISINNLYMSCDRNFKQKLAEYSNLPSVEVT